MTTQPQTLPLALYIHIPFCRFKCFYCDFNTYAGIEKLIPDYVTALTTEIRRWGEALRQNDIWASGQTIFFGGGTPSLLTPVQVAEILAAFGKTMPRLRSAEISMEVNPESVTREFVRDVMSLGVNRFSMGAQSFDNTELQMLGRLHDAGGVERAMNALRAGGADNVNLDLMYGLPRQTLKTWESSLTGALALTPEHLSLYALTVEESTPFHGWVESGRLPSPDPDLAADMYEMAEQRMAEAGLEQYEISNWAQPDRECRHNLAYWHNAPFIGFGPGAHSHLFGARFSVMRQPRSYIDRMAELAKQPITEPPLLPRIDGPVSAEDALNNIVLNDIAPIDSIDPYTDSMRRAETLVLGLRLNRGVVEEDYRERFGVLPSEIYADAIEASITDGLLERTGDSLDASGADGSPERSGNVLRLTPRGRLLSNEVFVRIMSSV